MIPKEKEVYTLFFLNGLLLLHYVKSIDPNIGNYTVTSNITITNVINPTNSISVPLNLNIIDETNIEIVANNISKEIEGDEIESFENNIDDPKKLQNTTLTCCLVIFPPKCNVTHCIVKRQKQCWDICTEDIVILEAPGFPKENFPAALLPTNWKKEHFEENIALPLAFQDTNKTGIINPNTSRPGSKGNRQMLPYRHFQPIYWQQYPYPYFTPQNMGNARLSNVQPYWLSAYGNIPHRNEAPNFKIQP